MFLKIENSPKLTIALLDGLSLGGGSELALACQAIVATSAGSMAFPETGIGIYPGLGGMLRLTRQVGPELAKYYVFTGASISAQDAKDMGIVQKLVDPADIPAAIQALVSEGRPDKYRCPESSGQIQTACGHVYAESRRILAGRKNPGRRIRRQRRKNAENHWIQSTAGP